MLRRCWQSNARRGVATRREWHGPTKSPRQPEGIEVLLARAGWWRFGLCCLWPLRGAAEEVMIRAWCCLRFLRDLKDREVRSRERHFSAHTGVAKARADFWGLHRGTCGKYIRGRYSRTFMREIHMGYLWEIYGRYVTGDTQNTKRKEIGPEW